MYRVPGMRLALGLGDQALEQRLRPALDASDDLLVTAQCLAADQLVQAVESRQVDAVLVAWSLHRLTDTVLELLERARLPLVVLVPDPENDRWLARQAAVLGLDADVADIRQALRDDRHGERTHRRVPTSGPVVLKPADSPERQSTGGTVIAVAGGAGSPGRTTVAINLATALGAVASTVLVEADLCAPAMAAYLDLDPTRNLCTLAHAVRDQSGPWSAALAEEQQPLIDRRGHLAVVLCGPPKREMRGSIAPSFLQRLGIELAARHRYVVVDVGPELLGMESAAANHRAVLASAHQVLLVCAPNMVGLWHARTALEQLEHQAAVQRKSLSLVLNQYDGRFHHPASEVEWHLGSPIAAIVPFDHNAMQRAVGEQRPLVIDASSRASRALLKLAEGVHRQGRVRLPLEGESVSWWRRIVDRQARAPLTRTPTRTQTRTRSALKRSPARMASRSSSSRTW